MKLYEIAAEYRVVVEDVKGVRTPKFERDVRLWAAYGPCPLHVVTGRNIEIILPVGISG